MSLAGCAAGKCAIADASAQGYGCPNVDDYWTVLGGLSKTDCDVFCVTKIAMSRPQQERQTRKLKSALAYRDLIKKQSPSLGPSPFGVSRASIASKKTNQTNSWSVRLSSLASILSAVRSLSSRSSMHSLTENAPKTIIIVLHYL